MGAVVTTVANYLALIRGPWRRMKEEHFGRADTHLHAKDLNGAPRDLLDPIRDFFLHSDFNRVGRGFTHATTHPGQQLVEASSDLRGNDELMASFALALMPKIAEAIPTTSYARAFMIFEATDRLRARYSRVFGTYHFAIQNDTGLHPIPTEKFFSPSKLAEPGVEVADFVAYAAGRQARASLAGRHADVPEWVRAVWTPPQGRFLSVSTMQLDPTESPKPR